MNVTSFVVNVWQAAIWRGTDNECYFVCCERLAGGNIERN